MNKERFVPFMTKELIRRYGEHRIGQVGGQIAYFFTLSIFPLLIFLNVIISMMKIPENQLIDFLTPILPSDVVSVIGEYIGYLNATTSISPLSVGILVILYTGSRVISSLTYAVDRAYGAKGRIGFLQNHLIPVLFMLGIGVSVIVTIVLGSVGSDAVFKLNELFKFEIISVELWEALRWAILISVLVMFLSSLYYFLPNVKQKFSSVLPGAAFAFIGWLVLVWGFSVYINGFLLKWGIYGPLGAIIVLMIWFYFIGILLILGAEINGVLLKYRSIYKY